VADQKMKFFSEGKLMNKLIAVLIAGAFAFGSTAAMAQGGVAPGGMGGGDKTPPQPVDQSQLKADRAKAKAAYANMTPEEKAAYKKQKAAQRQKDLQEQGAQATPNPPTTAAQTQALKAQKGTPKEIQTPQQRQDALKAAEKAPGAGGGGGN
jgi:flagellum-specific peptidoglycan hydrolase FlgJ